MREEGRETGGGGDNHQHIAASKWSDSSTVVQTLPSLTSSRVKIIPSTLSIVEIRKILMGCLNLTFYGQVLHMTVSDTAYANGFKKIYNISKAHKARKVLLLKFFK